MKKLLCLLIFAACTAVMAQETTAPTKMQVAGQQTPSVDSILAEQAQLNMVAQAPPKERVLLLKDFLKDHPKSAMINQVKQALAQTYAQLGDDLLRGGDVDQGLAQFRLSLKAAPDPITTVLFQQLYWNMPVVVYNYGHRNEGIQLMREFEPSFWQESDRLLEISSFYYGVEDAPDALRVLERAHELSPKDYKVNSSLGTVYITAFDFDKAEEEFRTTVELEPKAELAYTNLGNLARARGDYEKAAEYYQKQLEVTPNDSQAHGGLAIAKLALGKEAEGSAEVAQTLAASPNDYRFLTQLAYLYALNHNYDKAKEAATAAARIEPRYPWTQVVLANISLAQGRFADARDQLAAARKFASFPSLMFEIGKLAARNGQYDEALQTWSQVFSLDSSGQFKTSVGGQFPITASGIDGLIERERQASLFFKAPLGNQTEYQIAEGLLRFNGYFAALVKSKAEADKVRASGETKPAAGAPAEPAPTPATDTKPIVSAPAEAKSAAGSEVETKPAISVAPEPKVPISTEPKTLSGATSDPKTAASADNEAPDTPRPIDLAHKTTKADQSLPSTVDSTKQPVAEVVTGVKDTSQDVKVPDPKITEAKSPETTATDAKSVDPTKSVATDAGAGPKGSSPEAVSKAPPPTEEKPKDSAPAGESKATEASQPESAEYRQAFNRLDGEVAALNNIDDNRRIFRLLWLANQLIDAGVKLELAVSVAHVAYDAADTTPLPDDAFSEIHEKLTQDEQRAIVKSRAADALGRGLFKLDQNDQALKYLKIAVDRTPLKKDIKEFYWHDAVVTEAAGKPAEALDLYIKGYDPDAPLASIRYRVIEGLYKKINGSLDGLSEKLGKK